MLENQFIQFSEIPEDDCTIALPVVFGQEGTAFFFPLEDETDMQIQLVSPDGSIEYAEEFLHDRQVGYERVSISELINAGQVADMPDGTLFRFRVTAGREQTDYYSNVMCKRNSTEDLSVVKYKCEPDAFGFPFHLSGYAVVTLPILLSKPQYGQEDKIYTKTNGENVVLYSQHRKEWEGETEYLPEYIHDKIVTALACDEVFINGERVTKNGNYEVEWDNYDLLPDGTKTAKATFKVQANTLSRNSNY